jgi:phage shock protein A
MKTKASDVQAALTAADAAVQQIRSAAASLRTRRGELAQEQRRLQSENEGLYRQPLRRDDVKALVLLAIDRWSDEFLESWSPVLKDFAAPIGPRPKTLLAQDAAWDNANAAVSAAKAAVTRVEKQLADQDRQHAEATAKAERGEEYVRPRIAMISPDELTSAKRVLREADMTFASVELPGSVSLHRDTFARSNAPMMVQDAAVILKGGHTDMLASSDGQPVIDHYRNIFNGVLLPNVPQLARANQAIAVKGACFFLGDLIKAKVDKHFNSIVPTAIDDESALLTLERCRATIAANEERASALQNEINDIDSQLAQMKAGLKD